MVLWTAGVDLYRDGSLHLPPVPVGLGLTAPPPCIPEVAQVTAGGLAGSGVREAPPRPPELEKPVGKNRFCVVSLGIDGLFIPALFLLGTYLVSRPCPTAADTSESPHP